MARPTTKKKGPNPLLFVLGAIVGLGVIAVVLSMGGDDGGDDDGGGVAQTAPVEVEGALLPPFGASDGDEGAVGIAVPTVTGTTFAGDEITIGDGPAVVVFVAHWCPHCQAEVPVIADWLRENGEPDGVALLAVSTAVDEPRGNFPPSEWLAREGWDIPTMRDDDDGSAARAFGLRSFPYFVAIDADGNVAERRSGEIGVEGIEALVEAARGS